MAKREESLRERYKKRQEREQAYQKQVPTEDEPPLPPPVEPIHTDKKVKRNDPCPCGSGKKYKQCCGKP
jgi:preprotein translocase subunit SecA